MSHRHARLLTLLMATAGVCLTAPVAEAQSGRYMTWANRPVSTAPAMVGAALSQPAAASVDLPADPPRNRNDLIPRRVVPSQGPARPMMQTAAATLPASRGLTPASAWLGPRLAPAFAPDTPSPVAYAASEMVAAPTASPPPPPLPPSAAPIAAFAAAAPPTADPMAPRRDAAIFNLHRPTSAPAQAAPASTVDPQQAAVADPMAPRRDARIFQLQPQAPAAQAPASQAEQAPVPQQAQDGQPRSRYYSVHRDAGRQPDRPVLPEPVYFDSVTVDLAEPPATEPLVRDAQGRRRAVANLDPNPS